MPKFSMIRSIIFCLSLFSYKGITGHDCNYTSPPNLPLEGSSTINDPRAVVTSIPEKGQGIDQDLSKKEGLTAVHTAAVNGRYDELRSLLQKGADINARTTDGSTALHLSAAKGDREMVQIIINTDNAIVDVRNCNKETPLMLAERGRHTEVAKLLRDKINDMSSRLVRAAKLGDLDKAKMLLARGARLEYMDDEGGTALSGAAWRGNLDLVKYLVEEKGAQLETRNNDGRTPLSRAASKDRLEVVKYLVEERGAQLESKDNEGSTPLSWAAFMGKLGVVKYLVEERGAQLETRNKDGWTILMLAAFNGKMDVVQYLVDRGAQVNAKSTYGRTALSFAIERNHTAIADYLRSKGATA